MEQEAKEILTGKKASKTLSSVTFGFAILFLTGSCVLFILFAPLKTEFFGIDISFSTLDNPLQISLVFILLGLIFRALSVRPIGLEQKSVTLAVFCFVLLVHISSPVMTSLDSRWSLPTAKSLIKEGNADLDEYRSIIAPDDYRIEERNGHLYSIFPIGPSILATPVVLISNEEVIDRFYMDIERLVSSLLIAIASLFVYFIFLEELRNQKTALLGVFVFAFCTSVWSTATRGLWQHGPSIALLTLALFLAQKSRERPHVIQYLSLPLAVSYVVRPTNIIPLALFSLWILFTHRKYFLRYLLWASTVLVPFFVFNFSVYRSLLPPYYTSGRLDFHPHFFEALAANLFSPGRGLLIYSPVFILAISGICLKSKSRHFNGFDALLWAIIVLHWLVISSFPHWWAGHSYGPRFFSDMTPFFLYLLVPVFNELQKYKRKVNLLLTVAVFLLTALSFLFHARGALSVETFAWNSDPVDIEQNPERVWDWKDSPFLRGIR